ncbi:alpha-amylase family protein [Actinacidiphila sp. ITFR-21]|uniref:alpha-amylase family protein n=1 Tax=Actinacidiphila sp. ITFR-21 TaxID=3075199 RepID=UPI00288BA955|nr:alpha-amylase family protein [Streptomyces sp. ITFR-21]WNI14841.1 alpha-amylase family protein [Streptomyces sp. ITFR-21]
MAEHWYKQAVVYCVEVDSFQDSDGDGIGDLRGLIGRLDHIARLGATCLWLNPIHPSPLKDDGYDVSDFYAVDPRLGTLGDFADLLRAAADRGLRVIMDLVVNHTSDQHPWFRSAVADPESPYRDWYVWSDREPADRRQGMVFPGEQDETWTFSRKAGAWYYHRFYDCEPDLDIANPRVREEIKRITGFWAQLGVSGFRLDAAPFVIELTRPDRPDPPEDWDFLTELREHLSWIKGDAVVLAEANAKPERLPEFFGDAAGSGDRMHMLFDFRLNTRLLLALARGDAAPVRDVLRDGPPIPSSGQWARATFLRLHDEADLSQLDDREREDVFAAFGPEPEMQLYGRGIRRRLAPMLGGDQARLRLAYALMLALRGTPVLRYGEEIGMGEDLRLHGRDAIRTPMQWSAHRGGGFSTAPTRENATRLIRQGPYGYKHVNVTDQRRDPDSLLTFLEHATRMRRECPEAGEGTCSPTDAELPAAVLAHRADSPSGAVLFLHNLGAEPVTLALGRQPGTGPDFGEVFADRRYDEPAPDLAELRLGPHGFRWIRLNRHPG